MQSFEGRRTRSQGPADFEIYGCGKEDELLVEARRFIVGQRKWKEYETILMGTYLKFISNDENYLFYTLYPFFFTLKERMQDILGTNISWKIGHEAKKIYQNRYINKKLKYEKWVDELVDENSHLYRWKCESIRTKISKPHIPSRFNPSPKIETVFPTVSTPAISKSAFKADKKVNNSSFLTVNSGEKTNNNIFSSIISLSGSLLNVPLQSIKFLFGKK